MELESRIIDAMKAAGYYFDEINSHEGYILFHGDYSSHIYFETVDELVSWIDGVVFDDSRISDEVERIMFPERFS